MKGRRGSEAVDSTSELAAPRPRTQTPRTSPSAGLQVEAVLSQGSKVTPGCGWARRCVSNTATSGTGHCRGAAAPEDGAEDACQLLTAGSCCLLSPHLPTQPGLTGHSPGFEEPLLSALQALPATKALELTPGTLSLLHVPAPSSGLSMDSNLREPTQNVTHSYPFPPPSTWIYRVLFCASESRWRFLKCWLGCLRQGHCETDA